MTAATATNFDNETTASSTAAEAAVTLDMIKDMFLARHPNGTFTINPNGSAEASYVNAAGETQTFTMAAKVLKPGLFRRAFDYVRENPIKTGVAIAALGAVGYVVYRAYMNGTAAAFAATASDTASQAAEAGMAGPSQIEETLGAAANVVRLFA